MVDTAQLPFKFHRWYGKNRKKYVDKYPLRTEEQRKKQAYSDWCDHE